VFYDRYVENRNVDQNEFRGKSAKVSPIPVFDEIRDALPHPFWQGHEDEIACYWKAWALAFQHIKEPTGENGFVSNFLATCFNDYLFLWDSVFALVFGKYGRRVFNFQETLDNLYAKQHPDGFICRELAEEDGTDRFHRFDPSSTGPNILPWSEWESYQVTGDKLRLAQVFPVLLAYHQWLRAYRTWPDGTYWSSGWGAGLDNQPRLLKKAFRSGRESESSAFFHGHMTWVDSCLQAIFSARILLAMSEALGNADEAEMKDLQDEALSLTGALNGRCWDERTSYYYDIYSDGSLSSVKTISAYWALLADVVPSDRLSAFLAHLENPEEYNRPHRVPSMPADMEGYCPEGNYWCGGVWVFTNYMVLKGLTRVGYDALAHDIALNHLKNVTQVYRETGTIWENYAPEGAVRGTPAKPDFVGAGGITPIAILFEYILGLRAEEANAKLVWDVRRLEAHGVKNYPFGERGVLDLQCEERQSDDEEPRISVVSNIPIRLECRWNHGARSETRVVLPNR